MSNATAIERQRSAYDQRRIALLARVAALPDAVLRFKPAPAAWSALEVVQHLVLAERAIFGSYCADGTPKRTLANIIAYQAVMVVLTYGINVPVPSKAMEPDGSATLDELRQAWDVNHLWLRDYIARAAAGELRRAAFRHPVSGPLTLAQALRMGVAHLECHTRQIATLMQLSV